MTWGIAPLVVTLAVLAAACGGASNAPGGGPPPSSPRVARPVLPSPPATSGEALNATSAPLLPIDRFALPEFDISRFRTLLSQLRGTPVVVNIWASWCGPCKVEAPNLARAAREFGRRIQFIGVDIMDKRGAAAQFIRSEGWLYPSVFDPTGSIKTGLGFLGQPDTLFFDPTGRQVSISAGGTTVHAWSGPITLTALRAILPQLLRH